MADLGRRTVLSGIGVGLAAGLPLIRPFIRPVILPVILPGEPAAPAGVPFWRTRPHEDASDQAKSALRASRPVIPERLPSGPSQPVESSR